MSDGEGAAFSVDMAVRVYPGTNGEKHGILVEDFGEMPGEGVEIAGQRFAEPARRWAVQLDSGDLIFVDTEQLAAG